MTDELRGNDPGRWGHSLANLAEILLPLLGAVQARSVAEVGAYAGDLTRELLDWAEGSGGRVIAIDPTPQPELVELSEGREALELIREPSERALQQFPSTDAVIIDGDHNYYTVSQELRMIAGGLATPDSPIVLLHDVCWPHARRDAYYEPKRIPSPNRQPMVEGGAVFPGEPGIVEGGLPYKWVAEREGGPHNGVLTALEDFASGRDDLRVALVPAFYGLGLVWRHDAPWASAVAEIVDPLDGNPVLARLEANRVYHLAHEYSQRPEIDRLRARSQQATDLLRGLMESRALKLAERLSRLRNPRRAGSWREDAERVLDEG
jgi:Methyltransferase domain